MLWIGRYKKKLILWIGRYKKKLILWIGRYKKKLILWIGFVLELIFRNQLILKLDKLMSKTVGGIS